jgi:hypothetical protein
LSSLRPFAITLLTCASEANLPAVAFTQTLLDMRDVPLMNVDIGFERLVHDVSSIAIERRGDPVQGLARSRLLSYGHNFAGHKIRCNTV